MPHLNTLYYFIFYKYNTITLIYNMIMIMIIIIKIILKDTKYGILLLFNKRIKITVIITFINEKH